MGRGILLVTPVKNESSQLGDVIGHVADQSLRPVRWILVDDHSDDGSGELCRQAERAYPWIRAVEHRGSCRGRRLQEHVYEVQKTGFDFGTALCRDEGVHYAYLAVLDSDMLPERDYYERLVGIMEGLPGMGIVSGGVYGIGDDGSLRRERGNGRWPWGGARLIRRRCFEDIGGLHPVNSGDTVSAIRALALGYGVGQFPEVRTVQVRRTGSAMGLRRGYYLKGINDRFLGFPLPFAVSKALYRCCRESVALGAAYFWGYVTSFIRGDKVIDDPVVRRFCRWYFFRRIGSPGFPMAGNRHSGPSCAGRGSL
jgi:glycosyltransferase involved in cell wall biosynthesis